MRQEKPRLPDSTLCCPAGGALMCQAFGPLRPLINRGIPQTGRQTREKRPPLYSAEGLATRKSMSLPPSLSGKAPYMEKLYSRRSAE